MICPRGMFERSMEPPFQGNQVSILPKYPKIVNLLAYSTTLCHTQTSMNFFFATKKSSKKVLPAGVRA